MAVFEDTTPAPAPKPATMLTPDDLARLSSNHLHALYEAVEQTEAVLLGISNQPRIGDSFFGACLDQEDNRLSTLRNAIVQEMRRRGRPADFLIGEMWAEVILRHEVGNNGLRR